MHSEEKANEAALKRSDLASHATPLLSLELFKYLHGHRKSSVLFTLHDDKLFG